MNWAFYFQGNFLVLFVRLCYLVPATNEIFPKFPHFLWSWKDIGQIPRSFRINNNLHKLWSDLQNPVSSNCGVPLKEKNLQFYFCFVCIMFCNINLSELGLSFIMKQVQKCPLMDLTQKTNFWDGLFWLLYVLSPCFFAGSNMGQEFTKNWSYVVKGFYWLVH